METDIRTEFVVVVTTTDSADAAHELARSAVVARLAACAQVLGPMTSVYRWEGAVDEAREWRVEFKTTAARSAELRDHLRGVHSYDVPEIVCLPVVGGGQSYLDWIRASTA
ncbi:divalent-cation tolerance protein CutA [Hamadaea tsunoensis]|uniref:divalent-cation tolerance protein CutA n=1 Tax=Hamadaea tsunoensis TaxID=53368 RepID=UPI0004020A26|nr:divalent-cation tolerance protein CutA [Hamadaea tsunoensis]